MSAGLLVQEKKRKIDYQDDRHGGHLGILIETILAIFDLHVTPMPHTKFQVSWYFGSREEEKNRFSRWPPWRPSWISDRNDFSYFWSTCHPDVSYQVPSQLEFRFMRRREKTNFQVGRHSGHLGLRSEKNSYYIACISTSLPDASYKVSSQLAFWFRRRSEK